MICSKCGKEFEGRFCPWCGAASEESEKASATDKIAEEEALKVEEMPKAETPKAETPKVEAPVEETPKEEMLKAEEEKKIAEQAATEEKAEGSASAGKIKCPKCGNVFSGKFCPECGYKAAELDKCPVCGAPHKAGDKFCAECGYSYEKKPNAAAATVAGIGTAIKNSCKNALAFCKKHSKKVIATAVAVALILVIVVPISVVFTSPVQPANVDRIKIGDTQERVLSILGDPYDWKEGDTTFEYYSDNYLKIKKELDKISNMEDMESFGDFADALEKEEELNAKLEKLEYKETTISFDEDGLVTKVVYNACVSESEEQAKEIKSKEVLTESIRVYEKSEVVYTIKYTDKSIVKAIAQVTPDMLLDEYAFSIYDPFAPENKIELSCKVVENPDAGIRYFSTIGGVTYDLTADGTLTISGNGKVVKSGITNSGSIKNIIVQEGITEIEQGAFNGCNNLESITIPFIGDVMRAADDTHQYPFGYIFGTNSYNGGDQTYQLNYDVTSADGIITVGTTYSYYYIPLSLRSVTVTGGNILYGAFYGCSNLTNITLSDNVANIGEKAFFNCDGLTSIIMPDGVTSIGDEAFFSCNSLTSITISDSVTSIGEEAFRECRALKSITIPDSVASIGDGAFRYCDSLASVVIPVSVTSIGDYAFSGCSLLTSIVVPDSVTHIGEKAFSSCSLTNITLPFVGESPNSTENTHFEYIFGSWNNGVPDMLKEVVITGGTNIGERAFYECGYLTSIIIPNSVTSIGDRAFSGCSSLASITIPNSVKSIDNYAFSSCDSLTSIIIPDSVTNIGSSAFSHCSSLTSITIPNSVKSIDNYAFSSCDSLANIIIPNGVTSIGEHAFYNCNSLASITIPDSVTSIGYYAFDGCDSLTIYCEASSKPSGWNSSWNYSDCPVVWDCNNNEIADDGYIYFVHNGIRYMLKEGKVIVARQPRSLSGEIVLPESVAYKGNTYKVTAIRYEAFNKCRSLTSIIIPDSVTSIGSEAFSGCISLTNITIPNSVTSIGDEAFSGTKLIQKENGISYVDKWVVDCDSSLKQVQLRNNTVGIAKQAFQYCYSLANIIIPNGVISIGGYAFSCCYSLTIITIPDSVTSIGGDAFQYCSSLTIYCEASSKPSGWNSGWADSCPIVWNCNNNDVADDGYIYNTHNGIRYALKEGKATVPRQLKYLSGEVVLPESVAYKGNTYSVTNIGDNAFEECSSLTSITIPEGVTSIGYGAFAACDSLTSITIPNSVTNIGNYAFSMSRSLTSINFQGTMSQWEDISKDAYWNYNIGSFTVTCTDGKLDKNGNQI